MPLNMIYGQSLFEVKTLYTPFESRLWILFLPEAYLQGDTGCYAFYEVEILIRDSLRVYSRQVRYLRLFSTYSEMPSNQNMWSISLVKMPPHLQWEVIVWDRERRWGTSQRGTFSKEGWALSLFRHGEGYTIRNLTESQLVIYTLPSATYLGQAALYKGESSLPELTRYLSIEERRFTLQASGKWDTLRLSWRVKELPAGAYLVGLYVYQGENLYSQSFQSVRCK